MTPICFLALLFGLLCTLAAFYAGRVWRDGESMARPVAPDSGNGSKK